MLALDLNKESLEALIHIIRGQKVIVDFDLARIYGYETKRFNEQVKNNIEKFPQRYRFQLTKEETNFLWSKKSTLNKNNNMTGMHIKYLPYAFTEQGIYMLMTVLKGELATKQSIALIDAFKQMKDCIVENSNLLLNTNSYIESKFASYDKRFENVEEKLEMVMDNFIDPRTYKHYLIKNGERIESNIAYQEIYKMAERSIYIIDDYINIKTLQLLKNCNKNINIVIVSDNKAIDGIKDEYINDFKKDTNLDIVIKRNKGLFHSRYIVIDYNTNKFVLFFCGGSSKDGGNKINTIVEIEDKCAYRELLDKIV